jgi:hypothetical protein
MDPYEVLGIRRNASQEDIKKAYRREAMKWHPDRNNNSLESVAQFHEIADAYKALSAKGNETQFNDSRTNSSEKHTSSNYSQSDSSQSSSSTSNDAGENFADDLFWEVMLDFGIKLAGYGMPEKEILSSLKMRGCPDRLAATVAEKAFNIHAQYRNRSGNSNSAYVKEQREVDLQKAFIGSRNFLCSPKDTVEYYLGVFREFGQNAETRAFFRINSNNRLIRILVFSMLFFALFIAAIKNLPSQSEAKILSDLTLLQIPIGILSLMLIWTIYRKLWMFTLILGFIFSIAMMIFNTLAPQALGNNDSSILLIAISCYTPFIFTALFANYFYYRKAQKTIHSVNALFSNHEEKIAWIRNRSGTSSLAVLVSIVFLSLTVLIPKNEGLFDPLIFNSPEKFLMKEEQARLKSIEEEAGEFFDIAKSHFNSSPPDYLKASMAYAIAADNGSLLAAYQLGYMYYNGLGVRQDDSLAFKYFQLAVKAPLAYQPHNLNLASDYLAEAYNNLGIMYQNGYGTKQNTGYALNMYRKAIEFGSSHAKLNLKTAYSQSAGSRRQSLFKPAYK